jgi:hypothetical protein
MKDYLLDLIQYTHGLGVVDLVKVEGTTTETEITAYSDDRTVIIKGKFANPMPDFIGTFGMPNLSKLKTIVNFDEYDDTSIITVIKEQRDGQDVPVSIHFETANKDFINDYRLMAKAVVEDKVKKISFKGANWHVEFKPTLAGILRLKKQAQANSEEETFKAKTEGSDLKIYFGDHSTHSGNFVFQTGISGSLSKPWKWPVKVFLAIMDLPGDKTVRFSDDGVAEITVESGLSTYTYFLPALTK